MQWKLLQTASLVECAREQHNRHLMITEIPLPFDEQIGEEPVDGLLKIQIAIDIEIPHFRGHLQEQVDHRGGRTEDDFCVVGDDAACDPITLRPHFVHLAAYRTVTEFDVLFHVDARVGETGFQAPHLRSAHVLVLER